MRMQRSVSSQPAGILPMRPELVAEAAGLDQGLAAEGHVGADQVADRFALRAASRSGCSRSPSRTRPGTSAAAPAPTRGARRRRRRAPPDRHRPRRAARSSRGRRRRRRRGRRRPRRSWRRRRCCARPRGPAARAFGITASSRPAPPALRFQLRRVVDHQHDLVRRDRLRPQRLNRRGDAVDPLQREGADQHRDRRRGATPWAWGMGTGRFCQPTRLVTLAPMRREDRCES